MTFVWTVDGVITVFVIVVALLILAACGISILIDWTREKARALWRRVFA